MLPESVMIVEDEMVTARYIAGLVTKMGIRVSGIYDSAENAIKGLNSDVPELILMDVNIKGKRDGFELSEMIWQQHEIPVIYITAYCDNEALLQAFRPLSYGYVVKPFTPMDLEEVLGRAFKRNEGQKRPELAASPEAMIKLSSLHTFEPESARLYRNGEEVILSQKQRLLLAALVKNRNNTMGYIELEYAVWDDETVSSSALRTLIYSLRKAAPELELKTQSKSGYSLHV